MAYSYELAKGNKYFMKNTNAPRIAFIVYQQEISQKTGVWKNSLQLQI